MTSNAMCCYTVLDLQHENFSKYFSQRPLCYVHLGRTILLLPSPFPLSHGKSIVGYVCIWFIHKTHFFLCQSPLQETFVENIVLIRLVFGSNYQLLYYNRPLLPSSYIVSLCVQLFSSVFFLFPFQSFDSSGLKKNRPDCLASGKISQVYISKSINR